MKRQILTSFNSTDGKKLFKESLARGTAESFLHLSGNLAHQSEPAFCGLGSLAIVLNALEIDPNRPWKGAWRWYDETLLDCCSPLETIKSKGITFDEFASLAACNGLTVTSKRVQEGDPNTISKEEFIRDLKKVCGNSEGLTQMVVSFSRKTLHQTGDGHFSPVGCFHEESGMVLVLDVARFKYPSYFVHVDVLYEAMKPVDKVTLKSRGYFLLSKKHQPDSAQIDIMKRGGNYKSVIEAHLKSGGARGNNNCVTTGCSHDATEAALTKITPLSLSKTEGVVQALTVKLPEALSAANITRENAISQILSILVGNESEPGVLSISLRKPAVDLVVTEDESVSAVQHKLHAQQIELLVGQIEAMPIHQQIIKASKSVTNTLEERHQNALSTLLVVSLPGSVFLAIENPELRSYLMEAKYFVSQGPKSRCKSEVERMESQLTNLINKL
ncbi:Phytochelatin-domain-containing protein [Rhizoclosmatium globosum]|uniref:glutathione gamma-glutamylcysteinyltransferase n=1 Tax=Rhizoclosmatium globosum TaxID=329046 RepID=A0A1Y2CVA7_9FUNG|nr:Phytochelatin-domain-containing protein [Rhizoclosmatium globosum]|eukprot:ORY50990.1 Phytochelatin-domain-containing protein [Rhizoclosmatium globosum]